MRRILAIGLMIVVSLLFFSTAVLAKEVTVTGYGTSRDDALRDAMRAAVEQALGTLVNSETLVQNAQVVNDEIYTKSHGFVEDYQIISEQQANGQVAVTARITVNTEPNSKLRTKLQQLRLIDSIGDPRIGVIISEYYLSQPVIDPSGETTVVRVLRDAGFNRIVDPNQLAKNRYTDVIKAIAHGDRQSALNLATAHQLDFLVVGEAFSEYAGNLENSGVHSCRATMEAKIFKVDTGEIIAANSFQAGGVDITKFTAAKKSLNNAGELMGKFLVDKLMAYAGNPEKTLQLIIKGIPSYNKLSIIDSGLRRTNGVKNVFVRSYTSGTAVIDLNFTGNPRSLAATLEKLDGVNLAVVDVSNSVLQLVVR